MTNTCKSFLVALTSMIAAAIVLPASAVADTAGFLDHRSKGMQTCVRAILFGEKERKHVNVHGHHFNCKPMVHGIAGRRVVRLSHDQFGKDDQVTYTFRVDRRNRYIKDTLKVEVSKGVSIQSLLIDFDGVSNFNSLTYHDFASDVTAIKPVKVKRWQTASTQILYVVIAVLGFLGDR